MIVVYSYDERNGTQQAKVIFEKGFDNVYLLTGGIAVFGYENHDLLEGWHEGRDIPSTKQLKQQHHVAT